MTSWPRVTSSYFRAAAALGLALILCSLGIVLDSATKPWVVYEVLVVAVLSFAVVQAVTAVVAGPDNHGRKAKEAGCACIAARRRTLTRRLFVDLTARRYHGSWTAQPVVELARVGLAGASACASIHQLVERVEDDNGPAVVTRALHRSPRPSGRSSRFHGSARIEKARSACLPSTTARLRGVGLR